MMWQNGQQGNRYFTYPVILDTPQEVKWSHKEGKGEYGIAKWKAVPDARGYEVQFYKIYEGFEDEEEEGTENETPDYYYCKFVGEQKIPNQTNPPIEIDASQFIRINGSGTYVFTVKATSDKSGVSSSALSNFFKEEAEIAEEDPFVNLDVLADNTRFDYIAVESISLGG
ncbi:MAG: hypothetical protein GX025_01520, partial [Clostridiales bacterium]|nr:hypothetical protein [Clostridiales bacterium]